jgi:hypothetical protein
MTYPIVLAHRVCRFDKIWSDALDIDNNNDPKLDNLHYFKGLRTKLINHGFSAYRVPRTFARKYTLSKIKT